MKIVIDIPEMVYDAYKEWHKNKVATVEQSLIANGTPCEDRPKGHWREFYDCINCSECDYTWRHFKTDFCPNCGADMRGGRE